MDQKRTDILKRAQRAGTLTALHIDVQNRWNIQPAIEKAFRNVERLRFAFQRHNMPNIWAIWPIDEPRRKDELIQKVEDLDLLTSNNLDTLVTPDMQDTIYFKYTQSLISNQAFRKHHKTRAQQVFVIDGVFYDECVLNTATTIAEQFEDTSVIIPFDATNAPANTSLGQYRKLINRQFMYPEDGPELVHLTDTQQLLDTLDVA